MKNSIKYLLIFLVLISAFFLLNNVVSNNKFPPQTQQQKNDRIEVSQSISGTVEKHVVKSGQTALDLLKTTAQTKTQGEGKEAFVTEINGRLADNNRKEFWAFYVNGEQAQVGAGSYILKNGDQIEWKIETY